MGSGFRVVLALAFAAACLHTEAAAGIVSSGGLADDSGSGGSDFTAGVAQRAARPAALAVSHGEAGGGGLTFVKDRPAVVQSVSARSRVLSRSTNEKLPPGATDVLSGEAPPSDEGPPPAVGFESFPPPDYNNDYQVAPPPEEQGDVARPPRRPSSPRYDLFKSPPPKPSLPPQPRPPPRAPWPPYLPPGAPPPPAPELLRLRLIGGEGANATSGILQIWDEASQGFGALCVRRSLVVDKFGWNDMTPAVLICRQLGLPARAATLVSAESFPSVPFMRLRAKALAPEGDSICDNAERVASVLECEGVVVAPERGGSCMQVAKLNELAGNFLPIAVDCRGTGLPPPPPSLPPSPPRPDYAPGVNYTVRIVDPRTGLTTYPNGSRVSFGRLEVLQPAPGSSQPVWGTVCARNGLPPAVAQYACRAAGLPYLQAYTSSNRNRFYGKEVSLMPIHWVYLEDCRLRPQGLACGVVAGRPEAQALLRNSGVTSKSSWNPIRFLAKICKLEGNGLAHQGDAFVKCGDDNFPQPPPPPPPARPPPPPIAVRNDLQLNVTEYARNLYGVQFGVRHPVSGTTVWGTYCPLDDSLLWGNPARAIANVVCAQVSAGARPYAYFLFVDRARAYSYLPALPPPQVRRDAPAVLALLDCGAVADLTVANISLCAAEASEPLPMPPTLACMQDGWSNKLFSCQRTLLDTPDWVTVRLVGGANDSSGRLEVLSLAKGWGTVCAPNFEVKHAQAVCRDLDLPWTQAAVLRASVPPSPPSLRIAIDDLYCSYSSFYTDTPPPLSFVRDCVRRSSLPLLTCGHDADIGVACSGESTLPLPMPPPSPGYGGYGASTPPTYYGPYGGYGTPEPPAYGGYGTPEPPAYGRYAQP